MASVENREKIRRRLAEIIRRLEGRFGVPEKRKEGGDVLGAIIHTILSQNTNDRNSERAFLQLRNRFPTYEDLARASAAEIADAIRSAGLYRHKSIWIKELLQWTREEFGHYNADKICDWPTEQVVEKLSRLRGIGIKTIAVVLLFRCGRDIFPVDTHVHRIVRRLRLIPQNATPAQTFALLDPLIPPGKSLSLHVNLLKLGRTICLARNPKCAECPLLDDCPTGKSIFGI